MMEITVTVTASEELLSVFKSLAAALGDKRPHTICNQFGSDNKQIGRVGTINMDNYDPHTAIPTAPEPSANLAQAPTTPSVSGKEGDASNQPVVEAASAPTSARHYTFEAIANAGATLIDAGKMDLLMQLLDKFGIASLTELDPKKYSEMAAELKALGATM